MPDIVYSVCERKIATIRAMRSRSRAQNDYEVGGIHPEKWERGIEAENAQPPQHHK